MAMFCGEVAQRNIFILLRACGGRTERPGGAKQNWKVHFAANQVKSSQVKSMKFRRKTLISL